MVTSKALASLSAQSADSRRKNPPLAAPSHGRTAAPATPEFTDLHRDFCFLRVRNPDWNDFHLLDHLRKHTPAMTMDALRRLKRECGLESREAVRNILLQRVFGCGMELSHKQLNFIHKLHPELRDKDVRPTQPGELLVYECLFGRGVVGMGRYYVHLFADMYNGLVFGGFSHHRSVREGVGILQEHVLPHYTAQDTLIRTVLHSTSDSRDFREFRDIASSQFLVESGVGWEHTRRRFGIIQRFYRSVVLSDFFEVTKRSALPAFALQPFFLRWIEKYNTGCEFQQPRPLLRFDNQYS